ncbi:hypothetical protein ACL03H_01780 [Saccharopolyspora sp. MS10]|uniref:hypothetical protein n=1 Tax=Saccharopolyspora sp. MS10 TaxID=3385973 RepID=UPI0039A3023A
MRQMRRTWSRRDLGGALLAAGAGLVACSGEPGRPRPAPPEPTPPTGGAPVEQDAVALPTGALGANFNGAPEIATFAELEAVEASWLRGFCAMGDRRNGDLAVDRVLEAAARGYGTALSLKFQHGDGPLPRPGTPEMAADVNRLDEVLDRVLGRVDVLCIGNEPFLETREADRGRRLNEYYEALTRHAVDRRRQRPGGARTALFLGALNHLDRPGGRTPATARWLDFARRTPEIAGVDIHPHVGAPDGSRAYLDYVLPRLRPDQKILVTEFSLVLFWKEQLARPVAPEYGRRYGFPVGTPVWKAVRAAIEEPVPQEQWNDLCSLSPWYEQHRTFLHDEVERYRATGRLALATYGIAQDDPMVRDFGPDKMPWLFNSLFASKVVQPGPDGLPGRGYAWIEQFRASQRPEDRRPTR